MLNDRKITDWTQPVSSLDDRPQMTASALKAAFDSNTNQLKPAVNGMIDDLTGTTGAGNIGVEAIAGVTGTTVQAMLAALKALIDLCDTEDSVDDKLDLKADKTTTDKLIKTVSLDAETGVFTFTTDDGTQTTIDTMLEKIPVSCYLDGQEFVLVLDDGTEQRADLSDFLTPTEFTDSSTIDFSVSGSTVTATIKNNSVTLQMLESTVMSTIQGYVTAAQTAAGNASTSETNAGTYRDQAQTAATNSASSASEAGAKATLSQSWAIGGTGTRTGEDTNNSKYFSQRASTYATSAQGYSNSAMEQADLAETYKNQANSAADRAEQAAEDAEAIAGGDFIPISQKGAANGVATLGSDGKVPEGQLPEMSGVMYVNITESDGTYSADKTFAEIYETHQNGGVIFAIFETLHIPTYLFAGDQMVLFCIYTSSNYITVQIDNQEQVYVGAAPISSSNISFSPTDTLTSDNVQDAIEEVDGKVITTGATTVQTSAWSADTTYDGYGYRASIAMSNVTSDYVPSVTFGIAEAESGNFAPVADTYSGGVYIYAKEQPTEAVNVLSISCVRGG